MRKAKEKQPFMVVAPVAYPQPIVLCFGLLWLLSESVHPPEVWTSYEVRKYLLI